LLYKLVQDDRNAMHNVLRSFMHSYHVSGTTIYNRFTRVAPTSWQLKLMPDIHDRTVVKRVDCLSWFCPGLEDGAPPWLFEPA